MGKFTIKETNNGEGFVFNLKAANGEVIGTSQVYANLASCQNGIESVRASVAGEIEDQTVENYAEVKHPKFEVYKDKAGEFRFRLKARNGENILASEGYVAKAGCLNGIESVKTNAPDAEVEKA